MCRRRLCSLKSSKFALDKACTYTIHLFINTVRLYPSLTCIFSMGKYICPNSSVLSIAPREKRTCNLFFELMVWSKELLNLQKKAELCFEGGPDLTYDLYCETCLILVAGHSHNLAKFTSLPPICQQNTEYNDSKKHIFTDVKIYISAMWYEPVAYQNENRNGFGFNKKSFWRH